MMYWWCALCGVTESDVNKVSKTWANINDIGWICPKHNPNEIEQIRDILTPKIKEKIIEKLSNSFRDVVDNII